ncbi:MAG TPA: DsbA family protein [Burkholderiales bacterium]|nr:DsbA family protein [Burkholderiales bacterium]
MGKPSYRVSFELVRPVGAADHLLGPPQAPLTLVEYGDFECPNCRQAAPAVKLLLRRFPSLRVAFRHFPLEGVHPHALDAALAAEAAGAQGLFWEMHDLLFENQARLELHQLRGYAGRLGLDLVRYDAEMEARIHLRRVREHIDGGNRSGVRATPTFYLNGVIQDASFGLSALRNAVASFHLR